ncbi:MAG: S8 family peptidase, partial [Anaerolineales bacterium]|nr:S8 family peptidase [Anaerolineales bacterium]
MKNHQHRTRFIYLLIAFILLVSLLITPAVPGGPNAANYIVQGQDSPQVAQLVARYGGEVTSHLPIIQGVAARLTQQAYHRLLADPTVTAITPNYRVQAAGQGNLPETDYPDVIGADVVWAEGITGEGLAVAIVDTGIDKDHNGLKKDLAGNNGHIVAWVDFVAGKNQPVDQNGHGTHIAAIIANTDLGPDGDWNGVAPGVDLVGVRVLDANGGGSYDKVIQGIQWVIDHQDEYNIRVMNLSLVSAAQSPYWADPLNQAVMQAWAQGIVVVVAAGNGGPDPMTISVPGNTPYVITAGAFTDNYTPLNWDDDYIAPFSAAGPTLDGFVKPDVVAPGAHMVSLMKANDQLVRDNPEIQVNSQYASIAGTSQAAAVTSGAAALVLANNPNLTPDQVKYRLMYSSAVWVDPVTTEAIYSIWQQGAGRLNAPGAVFEDLDGAANAGLDIWADLAGDVHYQGYSYYDEDEGVFKLLGGYGTWSGGYGTWSGGYGTWSGGYGTWSGGYGTW